MVSEEKIKRLQELYKGKFKKAISKPEAIEIAIKLMAIVKQQKGGGKRWNG